MLDAYNQTRPSKYVSTHDHTPTYTEYSLCMKMWADMHATPFMSNRHALAAGEEVVPLLAPLVFPGSAANRGPAGRYGDVDSG